MIFHLRSGDLPARRSLGEGGQIALSRPGDCSLLNL
jgi:hypothetical protein